MLGNFGEFYCQSMTRIVGCSPEAKFVSTIKFNTFLILEFERA